MLALKKTGGVIQVVAYDGFVKKTKPDSPERIAALVAARKEVNLPEPTGPGQRARFQSALKALSDERRIEYEKNLAEIDKQYPGDQPANLKDFVDHIDYTVKLIGIDHVGISSDSSETFNVTLELVRHGYTEEQIGKLWSGNLLRVMDEVHRIARELQKN